MEVKTFDGPLRLSKVASLFSVISIERAPTFEMLDGPQNYNSNTHTLKDALAVECSWPIIPVSIVA